MSTAAEAAVLEVEDLRIEIDTPGGTVYPVDGITFSARAGEVLAVVGESGSGKSLTALTVLGLSRAGNLRTSGEIRYGGRELLGMPESELRTIRGAAISMIFQDPLSSLNPTMRIGEQIEEVILLHEQLDQAEAHRRAVEALAAVGIPEPELRSARYPHEFSGGMRQRVMIAMAMACNPRVLIADEPTTALDVTIQAQVLELMKTLRDEHGSAVILITHDLGVVAELADTVAVMYAGRIVEIGPRDQIFDDPRHPYTTGLLASIPRVDLPRAERLTGIPGTPPSPGDRPTGCAFRDRCRVAIDRCAELPELWMRKPEEPRHLDACWRSGEDRAALREILVAPA